MAPGRGGDRTSAVISGDLELELLVLRERAEARGIDLGLVHKNVGLLAVNRDEAEALGDIEPFAGARARVANTGHADGRYSQPRAQHRGGRWCKA